MKIRIGFVSNSSSSNFCIVGIQNSSHFFNSVLRNLKFDNDYECYGEFKTNDDNIIVVGYEDSPVAIGFDTKKEKYSLYDRTVKEVAKDFVSYIRKTYNIDIPLRDVRLVYGEFGD